MASRWRAWDTHFATDVLGGKLPIEAINIIPVGSRGRRKFNIPPNLLTIPSIAYTTQLNPDQKVSGRGRTLRQNKDIHQCKKNVLNIVGNEGYYNEIRKAKLEKEWPSLDNPSGNEISKAKLENKEKRPSLSVDNLASVTYTENNLKEGGKQTEYKSTITKEKNIKVLGCPFLTIENTNIQQINKHIEKFDDNKEQFEDVQEKANIQKELDETVTIINKEDKDNSNDNISLYDDSSDYASKDFLKTLSDVECYILIENLSINIDEESFKELITSFGDIEIYLAQLCSDKFHKVALVKMEVSSNCDWVISCLDGDIYEEGGKRLIARRVEDILES